MTESTIAGMINIREAPKLYGKLNEKLTEHILSCMNCRPGMRCLQYVSLLEISDNLKWVESSNDQKN